MSEWAGRDMKLKDENLTILLSALKSVMEWLHSIARGGILLQEPSKRSLRIFNKEECSSLSVSARGFLMDLEQQGILTSELREHIIHHALELGFSSIDLSLIQGITLVALAQQVKREETLDRMVLYSVSYDQNLIH